MVDAVGKSVTAAWQGFGELGGGALTFGQSSE
jgi:hypothetical protein